MYLPFPLDVTSVQITREDTMQANGWDLQGTITGYPEVTGRPPHIDRVRFDLDCSFEPGMIKWVMVHGPPGVTFTVRSWLAPVLVPVFGEDGLPTGDEEQVRPSVTIFNFAPSRATINEEGVFLRGWSVPNDDGNIFILVPHDSLTP